ncbi:MAG: DegT/DnrJ/EryC1/StrS family aminotransferase, partial [Acidimicrobiia bacterium]|nr:DegT/DnrJ/EryC1/StrS family aminotransferase [Acidimicrobiia bacterium]
HAIAVGSGTAALHVGLLAAGIGPGDEVIVPSFTFAATANAVALTGAAPVFIDIDPESYNITADLVRKAITPNTKAVMPVHLYGLAAPLDDLNEVVEEHNLRMFEDAAQAHGSEWKGLKAGSVGAFGAFSFYPTKNMTTGEGGMITTSDGDLAERARWIRNQGMSQRYTHELIGLNERMTSIEAAIGLVQLGRLPEFTLARRRNAAFYDANLDVRLGLPKVPAEAVHVYHQYTIQPPDRERTIEALESAGIGYGVYYPTGTHEQPPYRHLGIELPVTERVSRSVLSIPVRPDLTEDEIELIVETLNGVLT